MRSESPFNPNASFWRGHDLKSEVAWVRSDDYGSWRSTQQAHIDHMMGLRRWLPITRKQYWYWLECMYPDPYWQRGMFLCPECWSGALYTACWEDEDERYWLCFVTIEEAESDFARLRIPRDYSMEVILEKDEDPRTAALEQLVAAAVDEFERRGAENDAAYPMPLGPILKALGCEIGDEPGTEVEVVSAARVVVEAYEERGYGIGEEIEVLSDRLAALDNPAAADTPEA